MYQSFFLSSSEEGCQDLNLDSQNSYGGKNCLLFLLNCRSIRNKINDLEISLSDCKPYIMCLTETWLKSFEIQSFGINNYNLISNYCRSTNKGGGCGIWCHSTVNATPIDVTEYCIEKDIEICAVKIQIKNLSLLVLNVYRAPDGELEIFLLNLYMILEKLFDITVPIIVAGDFNINCCPKNYKYLQLMDTFESFNISRHVFDVTRVTTNTSTTIDNVFSNLTCDLECVLKDIHFSDHRLILLYSDIFTPITKFYEYRRSYKPDNKTCFLEGLQRESWIPVYNVHDINDKFNHFFEIFYYHFDTSFPNTKKQIRHNTDTWINDQIRRSSTNLKDLYILQKSYPILQNKYKINKDRHNKLITSTKFNFINTKIALSENKNKTTWSIINNLQNKNNSNSNSYGNLTIEIDNKIIDSPSVIANIFNEYFQKIPTIACQNIPNVAKSSSHIQINSHTMYLYPFSEPEMLKVFDKIKKKFTSGPDGIPANIIKLCQLELVKPITHLINCSFEQGVFPELLKTSKIKPFHKKGNLLNITNYRPITLSSGFSKLFEYAILNRIENFINKFNLLSPAQHGFRPGKSTTSALLDIYNSILENIEMKSYPVGVLCDLSKAFDCIQHNLLMQKLDVMGLRGRVAEWISSYLSGRFQFVEVTTSKTNTRYKIRSAYLPTNIGVPQGSVLGPLLFSLFLNDIVDFVSDFAVVCYADDITVIISDKECDVKTTANLILDKLFNWFCANKLSLNLNKTKHMLFHTVQKRIDDFDLQILNNVIKSTDSAPFLGLTFTSTLNWNTHCQELTSKLNKSIFKLRSLRNVVNLHTLKMIYYAEFQSHLLYGILLWGSSSAALKVFLKQKSAIRCIAGVSSLTSCRNYFKTLKILTLPEIYILESSLYIHKNKQIFINKNNNVHSYNIRAQQIHSMRHNLNITAKSADILGIKIYNNLPSEWKSWPLRKFKRTLKTWLHTQCFYSLDEFFDQVT